jgi:hypothetical protein
MSVNLHGDLLDLAVRTTADASQTTVIGSQADVSSNLKGVQVKVQVGVEAGAKPAAFQAIGYSPLMRPGAWDASRATFNAVWAPSSAAKVELNAHDRYRRDFDRPDTIWAGFSRRDVSARDTGAGAAATFAPFRALDLQMGASAWSHRVETVTLSSVLAPSSALDTRSRSVFAALQWRPLNRLTLEGGGKAESMGVAWKGAALAQTNYAFIQPRVGGTLAPWSGASVRVGLERVVASINTDQFVNFTQASEGSVTSVFEPDREWRYQASVRQRMLGDVELAAIFTQARLTSVTELAPIGAAQGPASIGAGERRQVEASLSAPLRLRGLPSLSLSAKGAWRESSVTDPFTGAQRRLSGESAYNAELALAQTLADGNIRWGVTAQANGPATYYQMGQVTTRSVTPGLGTFVEYNPGPLSVQFRLDNLIGGRQTDRDVYFNGGRGRGEPGRVDLIRNSNRAVKLALHRRL